MKIRFAITCFCTLPAAAVAQSPQWYPYGPAPTSRQILSPYDITQPGGANMTAAGAASAGQGIPTVRLHARPYRASRPPAPTVREIPSPLPAPATSFTPGAAGGPGAPVPGTTPQP